MRFCTKCGTRTVEPICPEDHRPTEALVALEASPEDRATREEDPLLSRFTLISLLGTDEIGSFYLAESIETGREVVVRIFPRDLSADESFSEAFEERVTRCRRVTTSHVAKLIDTGRTVGGSLFLVTEHVAGRSLDEVIEAQDLFDWVRVREMTLQILQAFTEIHRVGVLHWDFRPGQVFFEARSGGELSAVRILGLGIPWWRPEEPSAIEDSGTSAGEAPGEGEEGGEKEEAESPATPPGLATRQSIYAAPERSQRGAIDARSDLYALGATLYHVLTGQAPKGKVPRLHADDVPAGIPQGFLHLVSYLMSENANDRPWEAEEVVRAVIALPIGDEAEVGDINASLFGTSADSGDGIPLSVLGGQTPVVAAGDSTASRLEKSSLAQAAAKTSGRNIIAALLIVAIAVLLVLILLSMAAKAKAGPRDAWRGAEGPAACGMLPAVPGGLPGRLDVQKVKTSSMHSAPSSSITSRSTPRAIPAAGGTPSARARR